jgi:putative membrane protein
MMMWQTAGSWWMWLPMVLVWLGLFALIVWTLRAQAGTGSARSGDDAREVLDRRLARGDLDVDEYRVLREELERT